MTWNRFDFDDQLINFDAEGLNKISRIVIPLASLDQTLFNMSDEDRPIDSLLECQNVISEVLKARQIHWKVGFLDDLLDIKKFVPERYFQINCLLENIDEKSIFRIEYWTLKNNFKFYKFAFSSIKIKSKIFAEELELLWDILKFGRSRLSLTSIYLEFEYLYECLKVLQICENWQELNSIEFIYSEADPKIESEIIFNAVNKFKRNLGMIGILEIKRNEN